MTLDNCQKCHECPICSWMKGQKLGFQCRYDSENGIHNIYCYLCGDFKITDEVISNQVFNDNSTEATKKKAALSHYICQESENEKGLLINTKFLKNFLNSDPKLPTPAQQVVNLIRCIGGRVEKNGRALSSLPSNFSALIGAFDYKSAFDLLEELCGKGLVRGHINRSSDSDRPNMRDVNLTLEGWELYEREKRGLISGNYGFIAMKFNDEVLDPMVKEHLKPAIKDQLGYELLDMRDRAEAGIIDNIMRVRIRDAAFVLVDLSHANLGAYWEAGYAEGLGKPVLYLCECSKFDEAGTHFDVNHCTTIKWDSGNIKGFCEDVTATLKRTLII